MNVLFVMESFCLGGVEKVTLNLIQAIQAQALGGMVCAVAVQHDEGPLAAQFHALCSIYPIVDGHYKQPLIAVVKSFKPEVVVFTKGGLSRLVNRDVRPMVKRLIAIQHVPINLPEYSFVTNIKRIVGAAWLYRRLDKVVCVSAGIHSNLKHLLGLADSKLKLIHNPVISSDIRQAAAEGGCEYDNFFICVGRLHFQKGYDRLLTIAAQARRSVPDLKIVVLGEGPDRDVLQSRIKELGLTATVILHGNAVNPYKYIVRAKALLMTSRWEGLPTVLVEASELAVPIISFDCRYGPAEITDNGTCGVLIANGDDDGFARAIVRIAQGFTPSIPDVTSYRYGAAAGQYMELFING